MRWRKAARRCSSSKVFSHAEHLNMPFSSFMVASGHIEANGSFDNLDLWFSWARSCLLSSELVLKLYNCCILKQLNQSKTIKLTYQLAYLALVPFLLHSKVLPKVWSVTVADLEALIAVRTLEEAIFVLFLSFGVPFIFRFQLYCFDTSFLFVHILYMFR